VLEEGVVRGRETFGNIIKYLKMTASSNFGNMFSVLVASAFLPFLPMMPLHLVILDLLGLLPFRGGTSLRGIAGRPLCVHRSAVLEVIDAILREVEGRGHEGDENP
jgi:hypothetical protein